MTLRSALVALLLSMPLATTPASAQAITNLHDALPTDTVAYLRLSGDGDFVGAAPGSALYQALTTGDLAERGRGMLPALAAQLAGDDAIHAAAPWLGLLAGLRGPIELVALLPQGLPPTMANILLRAGVDVDSAAALNTLVAGWADSNPALELVTPLTDGGTGMLRYAGKVPMPYSFDSGAKVVYAITGMRADAASLQAAIAALQPSAGHRMYAIEAQLDNSGQGLFMWVDASRISPAMMAAADPAAMGAMGMAGALNSIAAGWGVRDGKGRLGVVIDLPRQGGMTAMVPPIDNQFELTARGQPWAFASINIPAEQILRTAEGLLQMDPEAAADYQISKSMFADSFGLSYEQLAAIIGPEWLLFADSVGEFGAVRVRDEAAMTSLLEGLASGNGVDYSHTDINGVRYYHLAISAPPATPAAAPAAASSGKHSKKNRKTADDEVGPKDDGLLVAAMEQLQAKSRTHLYWVREGEYLIFAQVPQLLMDRAAAQDPVVLGNWLVEQQRQRTDNALVVLSTRIDGVPRRTYYGWLQALEWAGDVIGQPLDLFAQTPASQLQLPDSGSYGLQLTVSDPYLSLEMSFDSGPFDPLLSPAGMFTAVAIGTAAAIAVAAAEDSANDDEEDSCGDDESVSE